MSIYSQVEEWVQDPTKLPQEYGLTNPRPWELEIHGSIIKSIQHILIETELKDVSQLRYFMDYHNLTDSNPPPFVQGRTFTEKLNLASKIGSLIRKEFFQLDPKLCFLAHGSYGASLKCTTQALRHWQEQTELQPVHFFYQELYPEVVKSLIQVAELMNTKPTKLMFVPNVEFGMNSILSSFLNSNNPFISSGDQVGCFKFTYGAVKETIETYCLRSRIECVTADAHIQSSEQELCESVEKLLKSSHGKIKLFAFEHITSPSAVLLPVKKITEICHKYACMVMIDGAHTLGSIDLDLEDLNPDFFVSNGHKWFGNTRGAGVIYAQEKYQSILKPTTLSWSQSHSSMHARFIWYGTADYAPFLTMRTAVAWWKTLLFEQTIFQRNQTSSSSETSSSLESNQPWKSRDSKLSSAPYLPAHIALNLAVTVWESETLVNCEQFPRNMGAVKVPVGGKQGEQLKAILVANDIEIPLFLVTNPKSGLAQQYMRLSCHLYNTWEDIVHLVRVVAVKWMNKDPKQVDDEISQFMQRWESGQI